MWLSRHDMTCIMLIAAPAIVAALAIALSPELSSQTKAFVIGLSGIGAAVSAWAYVAFVARQRAAWMSSLDQVVSSLWRSLDEQPPPRADQDPRDRAAWLVDSLQRASNPIALRTQQAAAQAANLLAIYNAQLSPSIVTDASGRVLMTNAAADAFFARGALTGRLLEDLFTHAEVLGMHAAALAGTTRMTQVRLSRPDGLKVFQVVAAPLPLRVVDDSQAATQSATGVVLTLRDVTVLALAVQLKTDFVANASHELRTPLSSIRAAVETLADGAWDDGPMREKLARMISGNVARLEEMVRDLLDLSRLESPDAPVLLESLSLRETLQGIVEAFEGVAMERKLTIELAIHPTLDHAIIESDRKLFTLVVRNLLDNATKFAYEGTKVLVRVGGLDSGSPRRTSTLSARAGLRIDVIDRGVGIPLGHQQRIFERFYQVDPSRAGLVARRGTGLGLAIVKHAVKALGGAIDVESVWKEGTRMTFELPACVLDATTLAGRS